VAARECQARNGTKTRNRELYLTLRAGHQAESRASQAVVMSNHDTQTNSSCKNYKTRGRRWGRRAALSLVVLLGLGGVAIAAGPGMHGHQHPKTPEEMHAHVHGMIDHLLEKVDGDEAQRTALRAVAGRALPQFTALHGEARDLKGEFRDLLTADRIDRAALEEARKDAVELADRGSKVVVTSLADAAEALTPAQRKQIAEAIARFGR
jgi:Spy/CpxP family protein refolding chaperone